MPSAPLPDIIGDAKTVHAMKEARATNVRRIVERIWRRVGLDMGMDVDVNVRLQAQLATGPA